MLANLMLLSALALTPATPYNEGNKLYAQKDYARAAQAYEQALKAGPSAEALYNLGNAWFKSGAVGRAIVRYRRAYCLRPRDEDIAANLAFARSYRVDKVLTLPSPLASTLDAAFHRLSRREAGFLAPAAFFLAALALALRIVRRQVAFSIAAGLFAAVFLYCFLTQQVWAGEVSARPAVVVVPEVNALSGPGEEFKQILLLHDGTEVKIREARGGYLLVQVPGGTGGWIRAAAVERVY